MKTESNLTRHYLKLLMGRELMMLMLRQVSTTKKILLKIRVLKRLKVLSRVSFILLLKIMTLLRNLNILLLIGQPMMVIKGSVPEIHV